VVKAVDNKEDWHTPVFLHSPLPNCRNGSQGCKVDKKLTRDKENRTFKSFTGCT
jgi:hypothetical protein